MGERTFLGELEHLVLAGAMQGRGEAYGASIIRTIEERTGRSVPAGSVYVTLDRLEEKGCLEAREGQPDPKRGGRPKRFLRVTASGERSLADHRKALLSIWAGLEERLEGGP